MQVQGAELNDNKTYLYARNRTEAGASLPVCCGTDVLVMEAWIYVMIGKAGRPGGAWHFQVQWWQA